MDQVTQQNAALVEEAAAASQSMQEQSASLAQIVSVFKLDGQAASSANHVAIAKPAAITRTAPAVKSKAPAARRSPVPRQQLAVAGVGGDWEAF